MQRSGLKKLGGGKSRSGEGGKRRIGETDKRKAKGVRHKADWEKLRAWGKGQKERIGRNGESGKLVAGRLHDSEHDKFIDVG